MDEGMNTNSDKHQKMMEIYNEFHKEAQRIHDEIKEIIARDKHRFDQDKIEKIRKNIDQII